MGRGNNTSNNNEAPTNSKSNNNNSNNQTTNRSSATPKQRRPSPHHSLILVRPLLLLVVYSIVLLYAATVWTAAPLLEKEIDTCPAAVKEEVNNKLRWWSNTIHFLKKKRKKKHQPSVLDSDPLFDSSNSHNSIMVAASFPTAFSEPLEISASELQLLQEFSQRVLKTSFRDQPIDSWFDTVAWGDQVAWWDSAKEGTKSSSPLVKIPGGHLLYSYYRIMKTHMKNPSDLSKDVYFPFGLCKHENCAAERAILHTLEWRLVYQPFAMTPSGIKENAQGFVYHRGLAKATSAGAHVMVWNRAGKHKAKDPLAYFRCILNAADRAVAEALQQSQGQVGKFNVVIDAAGYGWGTLPAIHYIKQAVQMLQDHYPNRLGAVLLVNLSRTAELIINVIKPLLTKEVRDKLYILPHDPKKLLAALEVIVDKQFIPTWLGGKDDFVVNVDTYYPESMHISEEQGKEFLTAMPYHA